MTGPDVDRTDHRFDPGRVPGEGLQPACSCGWRAPRGERTWAAAERFWRNYHINRLPAEDES